METTIKLVSDKSIRLQNAREKAIQSSTPQMLSEISSVIKSNTTIWGLGRDFHSNFKERMVAEALVVPLLEAFGWPEDQIKSRVPVLVDYNGRQRDLPPGAVKTGGRQDLVCYLPEHTLQNIIVEVEQVSDGHKNLHTSQAEGQLEKYASTHLLINNKETIIGVRTDGVKLLFYTNNMNKSQLDSDPFTVVDLNKFKGDAQALFSECWFMSYKTIHESLKVLPYYADVQNFHKVMGKAARQVYDIRKSGKNYIKRTYCLLNEIMNHYVPVIVNANDAVCYAVEVGIYAIENNITKKDMQEIIQSGQDVLLSTAKKRTWKKGEEKYLRDKMTGKNQITVSDFIKKVENGEDIDLNYRIGDSLKDCISAFSHIRVDETMLIDKKEVAMKVPTITAFLAKSLAKICVKHPDKAIDIIDKNGPLITYLDEGRTKYSVNSTAVYWDKEGGLHEALEYLKDDRVGLRNLGIGKDKNGNFRTDLTDEEKILLLDENGDAVSMGSGHWVMFRVKGEIVAFTISYSAGELYTLVSRVAEECGEDPSNYSFKANGYKSGKYAQKAESPSKEAKADDSEDGEGEDRVVKPGYEYEADVLFGSDLMGLRTAGVQVVG